jgi:hypothetical protein
VLKWGGIVKVGTKGKYGEVGSKNRETISSETSFKVAGDHRGRSFDFSTNTALTPLKKSGLAPF